MAPDRRRRGAHGAADDHEQRRRQRREGQSGGNLNFKVTDVQATKLAFAVRQREALARPAAGRGREDGAAVARDRGDADARRQAPARLQLARRPLMSLGAQTFLVVTDDSLAESTIRAALPPRRRFGSCRFATRSTRRQSWWRTPHRASCSSAARRTPSGVCASSATWRASSRAGRSSLCTTAIRTASWSPRSAPAPTT